METPVIFFDDVCVLCSRSVRFIFRNDPKRRFYYASLDSEAYKKIAHLMQDGKPEPESVILFKRGKIFLRSGASLRIAAGLRFPVSLLAAGLIIPPFIRNGIYNWIARNRYHWFGKMDHCFLPDEKLGKQFLD